MMALRNGHDPYNPRSSFNPGAPRRARNAASADPNPYQPGRLVRDWDHAKTHGMARSDSSDGPEAPAVAELLARAAGREPMASPLSSAMGVAARKYDSNPGVSQTRARYAVRAVSASSVMT